MIPSTGDAFDEKPLRAGGITARTRLNGVSAILALALILAGVQLFAPGGWLGLARRVFPPPAYQGPVIFTTTKTGALLALRASDGGMLWQRALDTPHVPQTIFAAPDGAVIAATEAQVIALDMRTGAARWRYDLPTATDVLPAQNGLIFLEHFNPPGQGAPISLSALDERSGAVRWQDNVPAQFGSDSTYNLRVNVAPQGIYLVAQIFDGHATTLKLLALNAQNGAARWQVSYPTQRQFHPIALDAAAGLVAVRTDDALRVFADASGAPVWTAALQGEQLLNTEDPILTCVISQGHVYTADLARQPNGSALVAFDAQTGAAAWRVGLPPAPNWRYGLRALDSAALAVQYGLTGEVLSQADGAARFSFSGYLVNPPASADARVILSADSATLQARDGVTGAPRWQRDLSDQDITTFAQTDATIYIGDGQRLQAVDLLSGAARWSIPLAQVLGNDLLVMG